MDIEQEKFDREIYWVVSEINELILVSSPSRQLFRYIVGYKPSFESPTLTIQRKVLLTLQVLGVIKIVSSLNETGKECEPKDGITFTLRPTAKFREYFIGLQEQLTYSDGHINAVYSGLQLNICIKDGDIFIGNEFLELRINEKKLRFAGIPRLIFEYLIDKAPNKLVTLDELKDNTEIPGTMRNLQEVAIKAGFKGLLNEHFLVVSMKDRLMLKANTTLSVKDAQALFQQLKPFNPDFIPPKKYT